MRKSKIYFLRREAGLTQYQLAKMIHVFPSVICRFENMKAHPSPEQLAKLAKVFNVGINDIIDADNSEWIKRSKNKTKLYNLRVSAGLSQMELAERLNVPQPCVSWWECGKRFPGRKIIPTLAKALGISDVELNTIIYEEQKRFSGESK